MLLQRRAFLGGLIGLVASPAIVRASSLMPIKSWVEPSSLYAELTAITRRAFVPMRTVELYWATPIFRQMLVEQDCNGIAGRAIDEAMLERDSILQGKYELAN